MASGNTDNRAPFAGRLAHDGAVKVATATATLKPYERLVEVQLAAADITLTLPPVGQMRGRSVQFYVNDSGSNAGSSVAIITDGGQGAKSFKASLASDGERLEIISDGEVWTMGSQHPQQRMAVIPMNAVATHAAGDVFSWQNELATAIIVTHMVLDVTTPATGACTADIGPAATAATTSDTAFDGVDIGAAAIVADMFTNGGSNGVGSFRLDANGGTTDFITCDASADSSGLVGNVYIYYHPVI